MGDPKTKFHQNAYYGSKIFDTLIVFLKDVFVKVCKKACKITQHAKRQQKSMQNYSACLGNFVCFCCHLFFFFFFKNNLSEFQSVWIQIRTDIRSVLIWVQTVCKDLEQTEKIATTKEKVKLRNLTEEDVIFFSCSSAPGVKEDSNSSVSSS